jgi:hypothetical protein
MHQTVGGQRIVVDARGRNVRVGRNFEGQIVSCVVWALRARIVHLHVVCTAATAMVGVEVWESASVHKDMPEQNTVPARHVLLANTAMTRG